MKNKILILIIGILIGAVLTSIGFYIYQKNNTNTNGGPDFSQNGEMSQIPNGGNGQMEQMEKTGEMGQMGQSSTSAETSGKTEVTETKTLTGEYETSTQDESAIKTSDGGNLTLENATITKTGDSTNTENSEFYGVNAVFSTGENAKVYVNGTAIN